MGLRRQLSGLVVAGVLVAVVGCTPPTGDGGGSGSTTTTLPTNLAHCPTPAAGQVRVAVVVDPTGLPGAGSTPSVVCVVVAATATGATALVARATRIGQTVPRYNQSGLLCAIDGAPAAPACGDPVSGSFAYWSYWTGGTKWTYATVGPAAHGVFDGDVEGWHWVPSGTATAPGASPSFAALTS